MKWKHITIVSISIMILFAIVFGAIIGFVYFGFSQKTKTIEGEVIDIEILNDGITDYWKIYFKDGTIIKARASGYGGNTYDFVKNSRVLLQFSRSKYFPQNYWTLNNVIKLPDKTIQLGES